MPDHAYSKLITGDDEAPGDDNVSENRCIDCRHSRRYRMLKLALSASIILLSLALVAIIILANSFPSPTPYSSQVPGSRHSSEYRFTSLGRDSRYMTRNHSADALWEVMLEDHLGEYTTPDGPFDRAEFSMFHQLRCIARFRLAIQQASEGRDVGMDFRHDHWPHCLDYMRKVVLCNADDTVEQPRLIQRHKDGSTYTGIEGAEEMRKCRSIQPMCAVLAERGIAKSACIAELDPVIRPWITEG